MGEARRRRDEARRAESLVPLVYRFAVGLPVAVPELETDVARLLIRELGPRIVGGVTVQTWPGRAAALQQLHALTDGIDPTNAAALAELDRMRAFLRDHRLGTLVVAAARAHPPAGTVEPGMPPA